MLSIRNLAGLGKAEYLLRPQQIVRRLWREAEGQRRAVKTVRLPWGLDISVNTGDAIGWSLYTRAIYETPVTEVLWRLVEPGDTVVDGGANIGYMTSVLAARAGAEGKIYCFEPHPVVFENLHANVSAWKARQLSPRYFLFPAALGAREGYASLALVDGFESNQGVARIEAGESRGAGRSFQVKMLPLDDVIPKTERVRLLKLDVEGYELEVFRGMEQLLSSRRVRHIVFEEVGAFPAATHKFLVQRGYVIFGIERHFGGIRLLRDAQPMFNPEQGPPPNYLATIEPEFALGRLQSGIWESFGPARVLGKWF